jgi:hypothetical protein
MSRRRTQRRQSKVRRPTSALGPDGTVFVSYSHKDRAFFERLMVHLRPLAKLIDVWADTRISAGDDWQREVQRGLGRATIAILLVSADFLASDFIINNELPTILEAARRRGTRILPIIVGPSRFSRDSELGRFQAMNSPTRPLLSMTEAERESVYDEVAAIIEQALAA